jgi:hypothetical protein
MSNNFFFNFCALHKFFLGKIPAACNGLNLGLLSLTTIDGWIGVSPLGFFSVTLVDITTSGTSKTCTEHRIKYHILINVF